MSRRPSILHVDDDRAIRETIQELLAGAGMDVRSFGSILEGIQAALSAPPDVVLLDLHMPDGDGYEACVAFRAVPELAAIPIILFTGMRGEEHEARARSCGATDYLFKPCDRATLVAAIRNQLTATNPA